MNTLWIERSWGGGCFTASIHRHKGIKPEFRVRKYNGMKMFSFRVSHVQMILSIVERIK